MFTGAAKICRVIYVILIVLICCAVSKRGISLPDHSLQVQVCLLKRAAMHLTVQEFHINYSN